jgi:hypothetical secreted protein
MKKIMRLFMLTFSILVLAACSNKPSKEAMNEELKKPEVVVVIEESLKNLDKDAFTEKGKIKSYDINYDKTEYNSRRGIEIEIYINGDSNLKLNSLITKDKGKYDVAVSVESKELDDFLEGRK